MTAQIRRRIGGIIVQVLLCAAIAALVYGATVNAIDHLQRAKIASGFGFWHEIAGFDISQHLIPYSQVSTYGRAFWVGLTNTLLIAALGVVFATVLGFLIGIARLSRNLLVARLAGAYVEGVRNIPLLLQLLFWYNAVLKALPDLRDSLSLGGIYLNNRGLFLPRPELTEVAGPALVALAGGLVGALGWIVVARWWRQRSGAVSPVWSVALILVLVPPILAGVQFGAPLAFAVPSIGRFNISGGIEVLPEFVALLFGLSVYTAAFIAEVVRAGIAAVPRGQSEAAAALGLSRGRALRLIIIPQAMRVIVPPLTNQYLNLTKNSTLAVAIGYPDLVQVFAGTVLNQTGQAIEVIAITMAVYLCISIATSTAMNWYNARVALVER